jgi:hypothetical protein
MTTTEQIIALRREAIEAGDTAQVKLCDLALAGDDEAMRECEGVIRAWEKEQKSHENDRNNC